MKRTLLLAASLLAVTVAVSADVEIGRKGQEDAFYVYENAHSPKNHYIPSGWMGAAKDMKYADAIADAPKGSKTSIKITYAPTDQSDPAWSGIFWQDSVNNWGTKPARYNLNGYSKLTFWAKSAGKVPLILNEVKVGGISGQYPDSDSISLGEIEVPTKWTQYTIDLKNHELSSMIGGFCIAMNRDSNPDGFALLLAAIKYER